VGGGQHRQHAHALHGQGRLPALGLFGLLGVFNGARVFAQVDEDAGEVAKHARIHWLAQCLADAQGFDQGFDGRGELALHRMDGALGAQRGQPALAGRVAQQYQRLVQRAAGVFQSGDAGIGRHQVVQQVGAGIHRQRRVAHDGLGAAFDRLQALPFGGGEPALELHFQQGRFGRRVARRCRQQVGGQGAGFGVLLLHHQGLKQHAAGGGAFGVVGVGVKRLERSHGAHRIGAIALGHLVHGRVRAGGGGRCRRGQAQGRQQQERAQQAPCGCTQPRLVRHAVIPWWAKWPWVEHCPDPRRAQAGLV
jgi:hypothetical protein